MKKSIGKKVIGLLSFLGIMLLLVCGTNMSALNIIKDINTVINTQNDDFQEAMMSGDFAAADTLQTQLAENGKHISLRIEGTIIFDVVLIVVILIQMAIIILMAVKSIADPAKQANKQLQEIVDDFAADRIDLTKRIRIRSQDEVGELANGINTFMESLQHLVEKLQKESDRMEISVNTTNEQIESANISVLNVSSAMQELSASMEEISATMEQLSDSGDTNLQGVQDISNSASDGNEMVSDIKSRAQLLHKQTKENRDKAVNVMEDMGGKLDQAVNDSQSVKKINELTDNILSIASQTNLLALNASIEAARAGDAGKGFAVVADEIRQLADNSRDTASDIQNISEIVMQAVERLSSNAQNLLHFMEGDIIRDYDSFEEVVSQYEKDADTISEIFTVFDEKTGIMATNMQQMSQGIRDITVTVEEGANGISNAAGEASALAGAIDMMKGEINNNKQVYTSLKKEVSRFQKV